MKKLRFFTALALVIGACMFAACSPTSSVPDVVGTWGEKAEGKPQITLEADGKFNGTDGCNVIGGTYTKTDAGLDFGPMYSTMMYCEGVDEWLLKGHHATVDGKVMTIFDEAGTEIGTLTKAS